MNGIVEHLPLVGGLFVLLGLSGFFSGSETALFALSRAQVRRMSDGGKRARAAAELLRQPARLLSTILIGNMFVNIMLATLIASAAGTYLDAGGPVTAIGSIVFSTLLLMIFGELTPKTLAYRRARVFSLTAAVPLLCFSRLITPVRAVLTRVARWLLAILGQRGIAGWGTLTEDEIAAMIAAGEAAGVTDENERKLVEHILHLNFIDAGDIMVPRTEVLGIEDNLTVSQAFRRACLCRHSRLPVYHGDLDHIWGILSVVDLPRWRDTPIMQKRLSDLRQELDEKALANPENLPVYPAYVFPETAEVEQLLTTMQETHIHFAVIVDEYGGTAGILTLEDILEEVIGQISPSAGEGGSGGGGVLRADRAVTVDGRMHVREVQNETGLEIPEENGIDSIGGYMMVRLGRLPRSGDEIIHEGHCFRVVKMTGRRVGAVRIESLESSERGRTGN